MPGSECVREDIIGILEEFKRSPDGFPLSRAAINSNFGICTSTESQFSEYLGSQNTILTSSGSTALLCALRALGITEADSVICQDFTFIASFEAIGLVGATAIAAPISQQLHLTLDSVKSLYDHSVKAVMVVHMLGYPNPEILEISQFCKENNIYLIEDTAWGLGAEVYGKKLGTYGDIGCFSFDYAKTITCGEGGACVTDDPVLAEKLYMSTDHGHTKFSPYGRLADPHQFFGFNFRLSEISAAIISRQLCSLPRIINHQRSLASVAAEIFADCPSCSLRYTGDHSLPTFDAIVFIFEDHRRASAFESLSKAIDLIVKILPLASHWHSAAHFTHLNFIKHPISRELYTGYYQSAVGLGTPLSLSQDSFRTKLLYLKNEICT